MSLWKPRAICLLVPLVRPAYLPHAGYCARHWHVTTVQGQVNECIQVLDQKQDLIPNVDCTEIKIKRRRGMCVYVFPQIHV